MTGPDEIRSVVSPPPKATKGTPPTTWLNKRNARVVVAVALLIKLALVVWNATAYDNRSYDYHLHKRYAASAGLRPSMRASNPPLYYLPALPFVEDTQKGKVKEGFTADGLVDLLRFTNIAYLALFYLCWIYLIIPKLVPNWKGATAASLVLLGFPGFQKLGAMTHPDNSVVGLSALGLATWLWFRKRPSRAGWKDWAGVAGFGLIIGLVGMTRPFAAVPVFVLSLAGVLVLARERGFFSWAFLSRAALLAVLAGTLSLSWPVYRWHEIGTFKPGYSEGWVGKFRKHRDDLDRVHYFTSFYFVDLLREPNLLNEAIGYDGYPKVTNDMSNSFPTIAYSEFWGDHWLYFSSRKYRTEGKLWPKRVLFVIALLMLPLLGLRFVGGVVTTGRRLARGDPDADTDSLMVLYFVLGVALYFYWLMGDALMPGANTSIKFIYNAHLVPVFVTVAFFKDIKPRQFNAWLAYAGLVFVAALPVATFWPF
jgi:hypothetical protein